MTRHETGKHLRIHLSEGDTWEGKPLYEEIVSLCRSSGIAGATVFRGLEGFGETAELHRSRLMNSDSPIVISIVDTDEKLAELAPRLEAIIDTGMLAYTDVRILRVESDGAGEAKNPEA